MAELQESRLTVITLKWYEAELERRAAMNKPDYAIYSGNERRAKQVLISACESYIKSGAQP